MVEAIAVVDAVAAWARRYPDIRAAALVGSWARGAARPDSDLDFVVLTDLPARYAKEDERLAALAELDLAFGPPSWAATDPVDPGTHRVVRDGMRPLHDPDRLLGDLALACGVSAGR